MSDTPIKAPARTPALARGWSARQDGTHINIDLKSPEDAQAFWAWLVEVV